MAIGTAEAAGEAKDSQVARTGRGVRKSRVGQTNGVEGQRYFLAKTGITSGAPELGKELATEPEAIVESLKTGLSYFTVLEWRGTADFSERKARLTKEAVIRAAKAG